MKKSFSTIFLALGVITIICPLTALPQSILTNHPPTIDGVISPGEWDHAGMVNFPHGYMLFQNDASNLYVLLDLTGDTVADPPLSNFPWGDYFALAFDVNLDGTITPNVDIYYGFYGNYNFGLVYFLGPYVYTGVHPSNSKMGAGFGQSLNSSTPHRIWELAISRGEIGALGNKMVRLGVETYSQNPSFDDELPQGLWGNFSNLLNIYLDLEPWTGSVPLSLKGTSTEVDNSGNVKFISSNQTFTGTMSLCIGGGGLVQQVGGCYIKFLGDDGTTNMCIRDIAAISTEVVKSKNEKMLFVGTGDLSLTIEGSIVTGIIYLDSTGSLKEDSSNNPISLGLSGKAGGGFNSQSTFSGTFKGTLTK